jgi:hypothetical protein
MRIRSTAAAAMTEIIARARAEDGAEAIVLGRSRCWASRPPSAAATSPAAQVTVPLAAK